MKINGIEVTRNDFEGLLKSIKNTRKWLSEGEVYQADFILESLESHLENNLLEDELKEGKEVA